MTDKPVSRAEDPTLAGMDSPELTHNTTFLAGGDTISQQSIWQSHQDSISDDLLMTKLLGSGGLGSVFRAKQSALGREVAVKKLHGSSDRTRGRFLAEACITAGLQHPNIIPIHGIEMDGDGSPLLVMKEVQGRTWKSLIIDRKLQLDEHLDILLKVCDAVAYAHSQGVLHRDLKGENVMVADYGEVLVMDWGCAVIFQDSDEWPAIIPRREALKGISGTPTYMSPEAANGDHQDLGPISDIYLLGAMLYEVLCRQPPHSGKTVDDVIESALSGTITAPHQRCPEADIPPELEAICLKALHKDREQRFQSAQAFASAIHGFRHHVEASKMAERARQLIEQHNEEQGDNILNQALALAQQAAESWLENVDFHRLVIDCHICYADNASQRDSHAIAQHHADQALQLAKVLADQERIDHADALLAEANENLALSQQRHEQVQRQKLMIISAVMTILIVLSGGIIVINAARSEAIDAQGIIIQQRDDLTKALENEALARQQAEQSLQRERAAIAERDQADQQRRLERQSAVPVLLDDARQALIEQRLHRAEALINTALDYAPNNVTAWQLSGILHLIREDWIKLQHSCERIVTNLVTTSNRSVADAWRNIATFSQLDPVQQTAASSRAKIGKALQQLNFGMFAREVFAVDGGNRQASRRTTTHQRS